MNDIDERVDQQLRAAGEAWRANRVSSGLRVDPALFERPAPARPPARGLLVSLAGTAAVAAILLLVVLVVPPTDRRPGIATDSPRPPPASLPPVTQATSSPAPEPTPAPTHVDQIVREGDAVVAVGRVTRQPGGPLRLCALAPMPARSDVDPRMCWGVNVPITGIDEADIPGWTELEGGGHTDYVRVGGLWDGGTLDVRSVAPTEAPDFSLVHPVPCDPPPAGWQGDPPNTLEAEQRGVQLQEVVDGDPELYSGIAVGQLPAGESSKYAVVVGTVGDLEEVRGRLTAIYPYNLCVIPAEYSAADLRPVEERLRSDDGTWQARVDVVADRVVLTLSVFDEEAARTIGDDMAKVIVKPLVEKAGVQPTQVPGPTASPEGDHVPDQIVARFRPGATDTDVEAFEARHRLSFLAYLALQRPPNEGWFVFRIPSGSSATDVRDQVAREDPWVCTVERIALGERDAIGPPEEDAPIPCVAEPTIGPYLDLPPLGSTPPHPAYTSPTN
jgi:hypothetical protein